MNLLQIVAPLRGACCFIRFDYNAYSLNGLLVCLNKRHSIFNKQIVCKNI